MPTIISGKTGEIHLNKAEKTSLSILIKQLSFVPAFLLLKSFLSPDFTYNDFVLFATVSTEADIDYTSTCKFYLWMVTFAVYCAVYLAVSLCLSLLPNTEHLFLSSVLFYFYCKAPMSNSAMICPWSDSKCGIQGPLWVLEDLQEGPLPKKR